MFEWLVAHMTLEISMAKGHLNNALKCYGHEVQAKVSREISS